MNKEFTVQECDAYEAEYSFIGPAQKKSFILCIHLINNYR